MSRFIHPLRRYHILLKVGLATVGCFAMLFASGVARSQTFAGESVTILVPHSPGGGTDTWTRHMAQFLGPDLPGKPAVGVQNVVGSRGLRAINRVEKARPDGTTLGVILLPGEALLNTFGLNPFNIQKFAWIGSFATASGGIIVKADSPYKSLADLQKASARRPLKMAVSNLNTSFGAGSVIAAKELNIDTTFVPQRGTSDIVLAVMRGDCDYGLVTYRAAQHAYDSGDVRYLWVYEHEREDFLPNVKTIGELGHPNLLTLFVTTYNIYTTTGVSEPRQKALSNALQQVVKNPEFVKKIKASLGRAQFESPAEIVQNIQAAKKLYGSYRDVLKPYVQ